MRKPLEGFLFAVFLIVMVPTSHAAAPDIGILGDPPQVVVQCTTDESRDEQAYEFCRLVDFDLGHVCYVVLDTNTNGGGRNQAAPTIDCLE